MAVKRPRLVPCAIYAPGREVTQLAIDGRNVPGTLAKVASKLAELGVNILSGFVMAEPGKETGHMVFFLDITDSSLPEEELAREIEKLDAVVKVDVTVEKIGDMAINGTTHETIFLDERTILLDVDDVGTMFGWFDRTFGTGAHAILFDMGEQAGRLAAQKLVETYKLEGRDAIEAFLALHRAAGWFGYEVVEYDEANLEFVIRLYDNFECVPFKGKKDRPMSHLVRGGLAGVFSGIYGRDFEVKEVRCLAQGDPFCEFVIRPRGS